MRKISIVAAFVIAGLAGSVRADDAPARPTVESPVYQAPGMDATTIAARGQACMAKMMTSNRTDEPLFVSATPAAGVLVAEQAFIFPARPLFFGKSKTTTEKGRSKVAFEARDGRFRITQTGLQFWGDSIGWADPARRLSEDEAEFLAAQNDQIAACVTKADSW